MASDKARLRREIAAEHRRKSREKLAELRAAVNAAKQRRRELVKGAVNRCRAERKLVRERMKRKHAELLAELRAEREREKQFARQRCALRKRRGKHEAASSIAATTGSLKSERAFIKEMRRAEKSAKERQRELRRSVTHAERRSESDDAVRDNLPADLVPVFDRVKRRIKGTARMSRTEAFLKWAEENPDEIVAVEAERAEREVAALIREHNAKAAAQYAGAVPF